MQVQATTQSKKTKRLEVRVNQQVKSLLEQAADIQGSSLSELISRSAEEVAKQIIREHKILQLSASESKKFANALLSPSKPNNALKNAYAKFKKEVSSEI